MGYGVCSIGSNARITSVRSTCSYIGKPASRARAFLEGRGYCLPEDVKAVAPDVLRHRVIPTYEAEADGIGPGDIVRRILDLVKMP